MFDLSLAETQEIDRQLEAKLELARTGSAEAEQLSLDSARLMSCTGDRLDKIKKMGFFKRCWSRLSGESKSLENANTADLIQMQKIAFRYVNMLQERDLMVAHSLLALRNNLLTLQIQEKETREMVNLLAQRTLERFKKLEKRVEKLEINQNLQGWLLALSEMDYIEKFSGRNMRFLRLINDFYKIKGDDWSYLDYLFMSKSLKTIDINPKSEITMGFFIDSLVDEIYSDEYGFQQFSELIVETAPAPVHEDYSESIISNISSQAFCVIHGCHHRYRDDHSTIEILKDQLRIDAPEALKILLKRFISELNVNLESKVSIHDMAFEILACLRLASHLSSGGLENSPPPNLPDQSNKVDPMLLEVTQHFVGMLQRDADKQRGYWHEWNYIQKWEKDNRDYRYEKLAASIEKYLIFGLIIDPAHLELCKSMARWMTSGNGPASSTVDLVRKYIESRGGSLHNIRYI